MSIFQPGKDDRGTAICVMEHSISNSKEQLEWSKIYSSPGIYYHQTDMHVEGA